jgi:hypothetical protein
MTDLHSVQRAEATRESEATIPSQWEPRGEPVLYCKCARVHVRNKTPIDIKTFDMPVVTGISTKCIVRVRKDMVVAG